MAQVDSGISLRENNQSYWQLALILSSGFGLVSTMVGAQISTEYGAGVAVTSVVLGNLILWFIGLGIMSMTSERVHTIQNIKENLGVVSTIVAAVVIVAAFLVWYALQIKYPADALTLLVDKYAHNYDNLSLKVGMALGVVCALVGMGGIKFLKWVNICSFPVLFVCIVYFLYKSDRVVSFEGSWGFSFSGMLLVILTWFPGTVNLATFFRHSRSKANSCLSLTIMSILHALFQLCFVFIGVTNPIQLILNDSGNIVHVLIVLCFVLLMFFCVNLLNIYWASVGWEMFTRDKHGAKGYAVIGLLGTMIYVFFASSSPIAFMESIGTVCIANLGAVLIVSYILKTIVQHRPRYIDKLSNSLCWFLGCFTAIGSLWLDSKNVPNAALVGICTSLIAFCMIMFIEEMTWSIKNLPRR